MIRTNSNNFDQSYILNHNDFCFCFFVCSELIEELGRARLKFGRGGKYRI